MYDSFDTLPILNWHNFLKSGDFKHLYKDGVKKFSEKKELKAYSVLIDSLGERKLINGYYARCLQLRVLFLISGDLKLEDEYEKIFHQYLDLLSENYEDFEVCGGIFETAKQAYSHYYKVNGHRKSIENRVFDFHYGKFNPVEYNFDLWEDLAILENFLKRPINPKTVSVNHYNAIKKQAMRQAKAAKQATK